MNKIKSFILVILSVVCINQASADFFINKGGIGPLVLGSCVLYQIGKSILRGAESGPLSARIAKTVGAASLFVGSALLATTAAYASTQVSSNSK